MDPFIRSDREQLLLFPYSMGVKVGQKDQGCSSPPLAENSTLLGVDAKFCSWLGWDERRVSKEPENEESRPGLIPKSSLPRVWLKTSSLTVSWKKTLEKLTENEGMIKHTFNVWDSLFCMMSLLSPSSLSPSVLLTVSERCSNDTGILASLAPTKSSKSKAY